MDRTAFAVEDIFGGFGPPERVECLVVSGEIVVDRSPEIIDAAVTAVSDALCRDFGEKLF